MKRSIFIIFFFPFILHGQPCDSSSFQNIYFNKNAHDTRLKSLFFSNGNMFVTGFTESAINKSADAWIMKMTLRGTPLWSRAIGTSATESIGGIRKTPDGGFIIVGSTRDNASYDQGWIAKTDANCIVQWSIVLKGSSGSISQISQLEDGSYAAAGSLFLKFTTDNTGNIDVQNSTNLILRLDKDGNILWWKSFHNTDNETLNNIVELKDGSLMATGNVVSKLDAYLIKLNPQNGDIIWMNGYENTENSGGAHITEMSDGSIQLVTSNKTYYFSADGKSLGGSQIGLRANGVTLADPSVAAMGSDLSGNEIYFANLSPKPVLFKVKSSSEIMWAHIFNEKDNKNSLKLRTGKIYNGNIYLTGIYKTDKISDSLNDEDLSYIIKSDLNGRTLCSDTFNISFNTSDFPPYTNMTYNLRYEGEIQPQFIKPYTESLEPLKLADCSPESCCKDELEYKYDTVCEGSSYLLPDGTTVTEPGIYAAQFNTVTGCDSIIYTYLSVKKPYPFNFSLGHDTCLVDNAPVTFILPSDGAVQYRWQDGSGSSTYTANFPGEYWVKASAACNSATDSVKIYDGCAQAIFIPSAFTPNKDALNDIFRIIDMKGQRLINFNIYNRYGQLVFATADAGKGWDGSISNIPQPSGTYVYFVRYIDLAGKPHQLKGTVVLIR